jgi:hypothetical protein
MCQAVTTISLYIQYVFDVEHLDYMHSIKSILIYLESCADVPLPPTVAETKMNFLKSYKRPIPSIYSTVLQELLVQQHLLRYKRTYRYDPVFALGFVTVYDQLMEGYSSDEDKDDIFKAYITALNEGPEQYRCLFITHMSGFGMHTLNLQLLANIFLSKGEDIYYFSAFEHQSWIFIKEMFYELLCALHPLNLPGILRVTGCYSFLASWH